jgi:hypothetical protein
VHRTNVAGLLPRSGANVVVEALGADGQFGRAGKATVRTPKVKGRRG